MYFVAILLHKQANQYLLILPELLDTPGKQTPGKYSLGRGENYSLLWNIFQTQVYFYCTQNDFIYEWYKRISMKSEYKFSYKPLMFFVSTNLSLLSPAARQVERRQVFTYLELMM